MKARLVRISFSFALGLAALSTPSPAAFATGSSFTCRDVFASGPPTPQLTATRKLLEMTGFGARRFDEPLYERELAYYRAALPNGRVREPRSAEAKFAFFEAASPDVSGARLRLSEWMRSAPPRERQKLRQLFSFTNFSSGVRPSQVQSIFARLSLVLRSEPRAISEILSRPISATLEKMILQKVEHDVMTHSVEEALKRTGFFAANSTRDVIFRDPRSVPALQFTMAVSILGASTKALGIPLGPIHQLVPQIEILRMARTSPELRDHVFANGLGAIPREHRGRLGLAARSDLAWSVGRRVLAVGVMGYAIGVFYQDFLTNFADAAEVPDDANPWDLTVGVVTYWVRTYRQANGWEPAPEVGAANEDEVARFQDELRNMTFD